MIHIIFSVLIVGAVAADYPITRHDELDTEETLILPRNDASESIYRLPINVIPLDYDIDIDLNFDATATREAYSYNGRVTIVIEAVETNVTEVVLHANVDSINSFSLISVNGTVALNPSNPITIEPQYHFLRVNLAEALITGVNYTLRIDYSSTMNDGPLRRGVWKGHYVDDSGDTKTYATTHFQPYNARQAFPCWDEPYFKATFTLHITRPANYSAVFSNTGIETTETLTDGRVKDNFSITPKMSSYLLTFLVSESFTVIAEDTTLNPPVRIIGRSNTVGLAGMALDFAVKMTAYFDQYFNIPYSTLHPNLFNDHISSPDWASAGTENWGMVSYRELYLILSRNETIMSIEHYAATLVSHELAHKWFGNLITCDWWSNTWINEGFASYFGYIATSQVFPEYEHDIHFNTRYLQASLSTDSAVSPPALHHEVNTPAQVTGHFGTISYSKGAAFLRMTADLITDETFRKATQFFLVDNAFEPTTVEDLHDAFARAIDEDQTLSEYPAFNFTQYFNTWSYEPGYPILNVDVDFTTGEISLRQERFFLSATAAPTGQIYPLPITFSTERNASFTSIKPSSIMMSEAAVVLKEPGEEWVIFNNMQRGLYRVNYNDRNWELITEALLSQPESVHFLNRGQIVDDIFPLIRSGRMTYGYGFQILRFLRSESNFHVWDPAISGYSWIRHRLRHLPDSQATFDSFVLSYMEHVIETVGFEPQENETPTTSQNRQAVLHFACLLGHAQCIQESRVRFVAMRDNGAWIDPRIRRNVYVNGIREGGLTDFEFLQSRYYQSNFANDQLEMLRALGATTDATLLTRYLEMTLTDSIRTQDKSTAFNYALLGSSQNAYVALQFVINNIDEIRTIYQEDAPNNPVHTVISNLAAYLDESGLVEFETWLQTQSHIPQYATAVSAIAASRSGMDWGSNNADTVLDAARDGATSLAVSSLVLCVMAMLAINV